MLLIYSQQIGAGERNANAGKENKWWEVNLFRVIRVKVF